MEENSWETWILISRYLGAGLALGLGGIGAAIGMGISAGDAVLGINRQPERQGYLLRTMLIGQAVGGSPSIFALVIGFLILLLRPSMPEQAAGNLMATFVGAGLAIGLGCFGSGAGCGVPGAAACAGVARNPRRVSKITSGMIIGQAMAQSPSIFAVVIALILLFRQVGGTDLAVMGVLLGSGFAIGAGALGPGLGSGLAAGGAVIGMGRWPRSHGLAIRSMLIAQAVCQTPVIFGLLIAFILMFALQDVGNTLPWFAKTLAAGIAVGFGGIGPGYGSGVAGYSGCEAIARNPRKQGLILRTMQIGQAVSQSTAIYAMIVALVILYVV